jgi:Flp pilus assembly protein TadD
MAAERLDRLPEMEASLRRLIALRPDHAHAYNALGYTFADRNIRLDEARTLIEKALTLLPEDPHILDSMGWVLFRQKDYPRALELLRKAYAMRPEVEIAAHLGEVLWASGNTEEARKLWREARTREPENTTLRETLARLNVAL